MLGYQIAKIWERNITKKKFNNEAFLEPVKSSVCSHIAIESPALQHFATMSVLHVKKHIKLFAQIILRFSAKKLKLNFFLQSQKKIVKAHENKGDKKCEKDIFSVLTLI